VADILRERGPGRHGRVSRWAYVSITGERAKGRSRFRRNDQSLSGLVSLIMEKQYDEKSRIIPVSPFIRNVDPGGRLYWLVLIAGGVLPCSIGMATRRMFRLFSPFCIPME